MEADKVALRKCTKTQKRRLSMTCVEGKCEGEIDVDIQVAVKCGCVSQMITHPCKECGRLHHSDGNGVFNRGGARAFFVDDCIDVRK